ncbi:recombinase family protein [Candidatus Nitrosocosmicus franklandus]|uniref:Putative DNA-invertase from lambdoid prophage Rac n=1 Tax=Candidatus Nitrosocosmicus franklandianus TaxID=1798806 RepID=A0A484ICJ2_9ARCH|nr:recombinase family protein [Candidatus Nitrosocosmicus franklandus]VFJ15474.1 putative DNA-invertase from lambdoid prophage Rac [Candidatus Nitrosocosmicus franklandus]
MKYAFAYLRVSTEDQTVMNQKISLQRWAGAHDYQILDYFEDSSTSGKTAATSRPGFKELLNLVEKEEIDAVLVYELSRIGRTFWDTLEAIKAVERFTPLISCSPRESFLQTTEPSIRKLMLGILTWVAERERELLIQRTKDGIIRAKSVGKQIGRPLKKINDKELITLLSQNKSKASIAKELGISKTTLYKNLKLL